MRDVVPAPPHGARGLRQALQKQRGRPLGPRLAPYNWFEPPCVLCFVCVFILLITSDLSMFFVLFFILLVASLCFFVCFVYVFDFVLLFSRAALKKRVGVPLPMANLTPTGYTTKLVS